MKSVRTLASGSTQFAQSNDVNREATAPAEVGFRWIAFEELMKRYGNLWSELVSFRNLMIAVGKASRGKRVQANVARFLFERERNLVQLQDELVLRTYRPEQYRTFEIFEPKRRMISAAPFRDRIVHHALCNVLEPIFETTFIHDSYACRKGKGTHAAINRFQDFAKRYRYVLKCDLRKFFPTVDHAILKQIVRRKIKDVDVLNLIDQLIDHSNPQENVDGWFPGDDLFTAIERKRGLPIGNQTSQFLANVLLNPFDHFVTEQLGARGYLRYVDDFAIFGDDPKRLDLIRDRSRWFLESLRLRLHTKKCVISRTSQGTKFLGFRIFPEYRRLPVSNLVRRRARLRQMQASYAAGEIELQSIRRRIISWIGHAGHANTDKLRADILGDAKFQLQQNHHESSKDKLE